MSYMKKCGWNLEPTINSLPQAEKRAVLIGKSWKLTVWILGFSLPSIWDRVTLPWAEEIGYDKMMVIVVMVIDNDRY